jgi:quinone-modifying oxidoreductase subunit QmoA
VCCAASLKQATYIRTAYPDARVAIFYIDIRVPGRLEQFYTKVAADEKIVFIKGKAAKVTAADTPGDLVVWAEDALAGQRCTVRADMVVLATGMVPQTADLPADLPRDEFNFAAVDGHAGLYAAGCAHRPSEVTAAAQDAAGAALHALQCVVRSARHG